MTRLSEYKLFSVVLSSHKHYRQPIRLKIPSVSPFSPVLKRSQDAEADAERLAQIQARG
jgi:hypothetical protein